MTRRTRWFAAMIALTLGVASVGLTLWVHFADSPNVRMLLRLCRNPETLRAALQGWGALAPLVFIGLQVLQVVLSPIPGEVTGFLGGFVFGEWRGLGYSMVGLTAGSLLAFGVGRWLGAAFVERLVSPAAWRRLGFVVEAEGAILCFILYLIPGLPKDILCYLFAKTPSGRQVVDFRRAAARPRSGPDDLLVQRVRPAVGLHVSGMFDPGDNSTAYRQIPFPIRSPASRWSLGGTGDFQFSTRSIILVERNSRRGRER
jgi:uncharacterized membrane protein YdjX (TVP38/TMEM64 family)